jgi:alpha-L-arabinofuranosidase
VECLGPDACHRLPGRGRKCTLGDALAVAIWLNVFVRQCRDVEMACLAQVVNAIAPLMTTQKGLAKQTAWWPYELLCRYVQGSLVAFDVECGTYEGSTTPA